jgi:hypothetical protein
MKKDNLEKWTSFLKGFLDNSFSHKTLANRPEAATFLVIKDSQKSILRLVDLTYYSKTQLQFEWSFLKMHEDTNGFPSQKPLNFFDISETIKGVELSYVEGHHPGVIAKRTFLHMVVHLPNFISSQGDYIMTTRRLGTLKE